MNLPKTDPTLLKKLRKSAGQRMSAFDLLEQRISWVHGQTGIDKAKIRHLATHSHTGAEP